MLALGRVVMHILTHETKQPTMDDLSQLDEVLAAHVHRTQQKAKRSRQVANLQ